MLLHFQHETRGGIISVMCILKQSVSDNNIESSYLLTRVALGSLWVNASKYTFPRGLLKKVFWRCEHKNHEHETISVSLTWP